MKSRLRLRLRLRSALFLALAPVLTLPACVGSDDTDSDEARDTFHPEGQSNVGKVTLLVPEGVAPWVRYEFDGLPIEPGKPLLVPIKDNTTWHCISAKLVRNEAVATMRECVFSPAQLQPGGSLTVALSTVKIWWSDVLRAQGDHVVVGGGPGVPSLVRTWENRAVPQWDVSSGRYAFYGANDVALPVMPGSYEYRVGNMPTTVFNVPPAVQVDVNSAARNPDIRRVILALADTPEYASTGKPEVRCEAGQDGALVNRPTSSANVTVSIETYIGTPHCKLYPAGSLPDGAVATFDVPKEGVSLALRRLDIDDVAIVTESGVREKGTYSIDLLDGDNFRPIIATQPTRTGVDLPPGKYRVNVAYSHAGKNLETHQEVQL